MRPLQIKNPYIDKELIQTRGPYRQRAPTDHGPLQTRGPYRQRVPTDQGPLQRRDPYRRCAISADKGPVQIKDPYMIYRERAPYRYAGSP